MIRTAPRAPGFHNYTTQDVRNQLTGCRADARRWRDRPRLRAVCLRLALDARAELRLRALAAA